MSEQYLNAHQAQLLTEEAVQVMQMLIASNNGHPVLKQYLEILNNAKAQGIETSYALLRQSLMDEHQQGEEDSDDGN